MTDADSLDVAADLALRELLEQAARNVGASYGAMPLGQASADAIRCRLIAFGEHVAGAWPELVDAVWVLATNVADLIEGADRAG